MYSVFCTILYTVPYSITQPLILSSKRTNLSDCIPRFTRNTDRGIRDIKRCSTHVCHNSAGPPSSHHYHQQQRTTSICHTKQEATAAEREREIDRLDYASSRPTVIVVWCISTIQEMMILRHFASFCVVGNDSSCCCVICLEASIA